jgi:hypothetical protein
VSRAGGVALILGCVIVSALSTYETVAVRRVNGRFTTFVRIESERPSAVRQVTWDTASWPTPLPSAVPKGAADGPDAYWDFRHAPVRPGEDGVIEIEGRVGGRASPFRILQNRRVYERLVILKIEFEDAATVYWWAEVDPTDRASVTVVHIPADG